MTDWVRQEKEQGDDEEEKDEGELSEVDEGKYANMFNATARSLGRCLS